MFGQLLRAAIEHGRRVGTVSPGPLERQWAGHARRDARAQRAAPRANTSLKGRAVPYTDLKRGMDHGQPQAALAIGGPPHPASRPGALMETRAAGGVEPGHWAHPGYPPLPHGEPGAGGSPAPLAEE